MNNEHQAVTAIFTMEEMKGLYELLKHQYIPHENKGAHSAMFKISRLVRRDETIRTNSDKPQE